MSVEESGPIDSVGNLDVCEEEEAFIIDDEEATSFSASDPSPPICLSKEEQALIKTSLAIMVVKRRWEADQNRDDDASEKKRKSSPAERMFLSPWMEDELPLLPECNSKPSASESLLPVDTRDTRTDEVDESSHLEAIYKIALQQQRDHGRIRRGLVMNLLKHLQRIPFMSEEQQEEKRLFLAESVKQYPKIVSQMLFTLFADDQLGGPPSDAEALITWIRKVLLQIWPFQLGKGPEGINVSTTTSALSRVAPDDAVYFIPILQMLGATHNGGTSSFPTALKNAPLQAAAPNTVESLAELYLDFVHYQEDGGWAETTSLAASQSLLLKVYEKCMDL